VRARLFHMEEIDRTPDQVGIICARCGWTAAGPGLDMGGTDPDETHGEIN